MRLQSITPLFAIVLISCGPQREPIRHPGISEPIGYITLPSRWERKGISDGGRTANLLVPRSLDLEIAENSTTPAISVDLIGAPNGRFRGPHDQSYWVNEYVSGQAHQYAPNMKVENSGMVTHAQFGSIKLFRVADRHWGHSLIATMLNSDGWHLFELKASSEESLSEYREDFLSMIESARLNNDEQMGSVLTDSHHAP